MSDSARSSQNPNTNVPRAIVHKKILDAAEADPDASIEELGESVNGASADLVEQVLDEYGDPVAKESVQTEDSQEADSEPHVDDPTVKEETVVPREVLSEKQQETLRAINENPEATQKELAEKFGVTSATISNRVNNIDGFEWENRQAIVEKLYGNNTSPEKTDMENTQIDQNLSDQLNRLEQRIETLEEDYETESCLPFSDPEIVHKIVHACMKSDQISGTEELLILRKILGFEQ